VTYRVAFLNKTWNILVVASIIVTVLMYVAFLWAYSMFALTVKKGMYHLLHHMVQMPIVFVCILVMIVLLLATDLCVLYVWHLQKPTEEDEAIQEQVPDAPSNLSLLKQFSAQAMTPSYQVFYTGKCTAACLAMIAFVLFITFLFVSSCSSKITSEPYHDCQEVDGHCSITLDVNEEMRKPLKLFYSMEPFYQNYDAYIKSDVLAYASVFNDTFRIIEAGGLKGSSPLRETGLNWPSDKKVYKKPVGTLPQEVQATTVSDEHLASWMKPGAIPVIKKTYGFLDVDLQIGDKVSIDIDVQYRPEGVTKSVGLMETGRFCTSYRTELEQALMFAVPVCLLFSYLMFKESSGKGSANARECVDVGRFQQPLLPK